MYTTTMSDERYIAFIKNSSEGIWLCEVDTPIPIALPVKKQVELMFKHAYLAEANDAFAKMYGLDSPEKMIGARLHELMVQDDPKNTAYLRAFVESSYRLSGVESHEKDTQGNDKYFRNSLVGAVEDGMLLRAWGTQHDITDYHTATEALKKSEERLALTLQASNMGTWEWNLETDEHTWSEEVKTLFGLKPSDEFNYEKYVSMVHPEDRNRMQEAIAKALKYGKGYQVERRAIWPDGSVHWILSQGKAFLKDGKPVRILGTSMNIDNRKLYEIRLQESEERFRTMADTAPVLIWISDTLKQCIYLNKPWLDFTGRSADEEYGYGWLEQVHPQDIERLKLIYDTAFNKRESFTMEYRLKRHDDVYRLVLVSASPRFSANKEFLGYIGSCIDVEDFARSKRRTEELEEINKKLTSQRRQLMQLNKSKDEFISLASHQLRTPATGVKQYLAMLLEGYAGSLSEEQFHMAKTAYESNDRQLTIINDLLRVAQVDAGKVVLKKSDVNLIQLLADVVHEQSTKFQHKKQTLVFTAPSEPIEAKLDNAKMRMVFDNLIDNASKYTPSDKTIAVTIAEKPRHITVCIRDEGIGMSPEDMHKLFQKFSRLENTQGLSVEGSGLGLYWAKKIINLHKATLKVTSKLNQGSTFTVTIPKT